MAKFTWIVFVIIYFFFFPYYAIADSKERYVTLVNPVRERNKWSSISSIERHIKLITSNNLPATWLLQYSLLEDDISVNIFKKLPTNQEIGVFLEVDENLASDSLVSYRIGFGDWARADKVLLSGYEPDERLRIIDNIFNKFKDTFGYYPKSVGAWYIDTISLNYMVNKYHIQTVIDVADQYQTDTYGLWGKPWGVPYYPDSNNSLVPAQSLTTKLNVVKIQWAVRDPIKGYGLNVFASTYSIQANDYFGHHHLSTSYFAGLIKDYLFSGNDLSQVTVGLEAGQEGDKFADEYERQIGYLLTLKAEGQIQFVNMKLFSEIFKNRFPKLSPSMLVQSINDNNNIETSFWYSTTYYRLGLFQKDNKLYIRDIRIYSYPFVFEDIVDKDSAFILKRIIPPVIDDVVDHNAKLLIDRISNIEGKISANNTLLIIKEVGGIEHQLDLSTDRILFDQKELFDRYKKHNLFNEIIQQLVLLLVKYRVSKSHKWQGNLRFSYINNSYYLGYLLKPEFLFGIRSEFPFFGVFNFPFQVLNKFKSFPDVKITDILDNYFIKSVNHSTIDLVRGMKI